jgi:hypothetical protein
MKKWSWHRPLDFCMLHTAKKITKDTAIMKHNDKKILNYKLPLDTIFDHFRHVTSINNILVSNIFSKSVIGWTQREKIFWSTDIEFPVVFPLEERDTTIRYCTSVRWRLALLAPRFTVYLLFPASSGSFGIINWYLQCVSFHWDKEYLQCSLMP